MGEASEIPEYPSSPASAGAPTSNVVAHCFKSIRTSSIIFNSKLIKFEFLGAALLLQSSLVYVGVQATEGLTVDIAPGPSQGREPLSNPSTVRENSRAALNRFIDRARPSENSVLLQPCMYFSHFTLPPRASKENNCGYPGVAIVVNLCLACQTPTRALCRTTKDQVR